MRLVSFHISLFNLAFKPSNPKLAMQPDLHAWTMQSPKCPFIYGIGESLQITEKR